MTDHPRIEELVVAQALGRLEPVEREEFDRLMASHGTTCVRCLRLVAESEEVAGRLAFALEPAEVPAELEDRLMERVRGPRGRLWRVPMKRFVGAAAAAAVLLSAGAVGGYVLTRQPTPEIAEAMRYLTRPQVHVVPLSGEVASLALAFRPGQRVAYLVGSGIPAPGEGKVYELWLGRDDKLVPAGTFSPEGDLVAFRVRSDPSTATLAAVTIERAPGVASPTRDPVFAGEIRAN